MKNKLSILGVGLISIVTLATFLKAGQYTFQSPTVTTVQGTVGVSGSTVTVEGLGGAPITVQAPDGNTTPIPDSGSLTPTGVQNVNIVSSGTPTNTLYTVAITTFVYTQPRPCTPADISSVTITNSESVLVLADSASRIGYQINSLPTSENAANAGAVYCRWGTGPALATDAVILMPGGQISSNGSYLEKGEFHCIGGAGCSGGCVVRGYNCTP